MRILKRWRTISAVAGAGVALFGIVVGTTSSANAVVAKPTAQTDSPIPTGASRAWSGYVSQHPPTAALAARVVLPQVTCNTTGTGLAAFWIGYDGWLPSSKTVEQEGVSAYCQRKGGAPSFYLWYELFKNHTPTVAAVTIPIKIRLAATDAVDLFMNKIPGGKVRGKVQPDSIYFSINVDNSDGASLMKTWTKTVQEPAGFGAKYDSSECIAEDPVNNVGPYLMPNFGTVTFENCSPIDDAKSTANLLRIGMYENPKTKSRPMAVTSVFQRNEDEDGENSFTVTWKASK